MVIKPIEVKDRPPLFTNLINRCPATMLAAKRTERVIGRIKFLTSSIKTISGIKGAGVPDGTRWDKNLPKAVKKNLTSIIIQTTTAKQTVKEILLVGVYVYGVKPIKFITQICKNIIKHTWIKKGATLLFIGVLNSLNNIFITLRNNLTLRLEEILKKLGLTTELNIIREIIITTQFKDRLSLVLGSKILNKLFIKCSDS